ncbi:MAG: hypothetical protein ACYCOU_06815 [Sulfobacillus sp.]
MPQKIAYTFKSPPTTFAELSALLKDTSLESCAAMAVLNALAAPADAYLVAEGPEVRVFSTFTALAEFAGSDGLSFKVLGAEQEVTTRVAPNRIPRLVWIFRDALTRIKTREEIKTLLLEPEYAEIKQAGGILYADLAAEIRETLKKFPAERETQK